MTELLRINKQHIEEAFVCKSPFDELKLIGRNWPVRNGPTRAVVLFVHGSGEHGQRYGHVAQFFNSHQIACVTFDLRGHGQSDGARGYTPCANALHDDLECISEHIKIKLYPGVPLVIYAHGTGSLICLTHIMRRSAKARCYHAMIISTPSICLRKRPTWLSLFIARIFANLDPHFLLPIGGNRTNKYTDDPEIEADYRSDPLVHDRWPAATVSLFMELVRLLEKKRLYAPCPLLIQHGDADEVTPIAGIRKWKEKRAIGDVQLKEWSKNYHELHNCQNRKDILSFDIQWIKEKLKI